MRRTDLPDVLAHVQGGAAALEAESLAYLEQLRWPAGPECPRCGERSRLLWLQSRSKWHCYGCRYQFRVTAGTLFHNSHLPLWKWFVAVHLLVETPEGTSAAQLHKVLPCTYKTAWFAAHRIRAAMSSHRSRRGADAAAKARMPAPYLHASLKYRSAYVQEARWRAAKRGSASAFRDTILALLSGSELPYRELIGATAA